jgi:catechol 2,3-dioxygenase-like lactoylglutathione lyase family enzyme
VGLSDFPAQAAVPAVDLERARGWYERKLGLRPSEDISGQLTYECGGTQFVLFQSSGSASGTHTQMAWIVRDLDSVMAELRSNGVEFEEYDTPALKTEDGVATITGERGAWFKDSEGNLLSLGELQ